MFRDVRMRGFQRRTSVEDARAWIDALPSPAPSGSEDVPLAEAAGRILGVDVASPVSIPPFARSAMDGWALRAQETFGASETDALHVRVVGTALPGRPFPRRLEAGEAARIMTGAPVPEGADAILRAEDGSQTGDTLAVRAAVAVHQHVGRVGEDIVAGRRVLAAGRRLRPQDVALLASIGFGEATVRVCPRVQILATGDELLPAGSAPHGAKIVDSNSPMLRELIRRDGAVVQRARLLPDGAETIRAALQEAANDADVVLVTGGSSVGEEDHAPRLLAELGELAIHGVAMRPAAPTGMGTLREASIFLLPGNPVSCLSAYDFFAGRRVHALGGSCEDYAPYASRRAVLGRKLTSVLGRVDYVRVRFEEDRVLPVMARGASILSSVTEADGFIVVPRDSEGQVEGESVEVFLY